MTPRGSTHREGGWLVGGHHGDPDAGFRQFAAASTPRLHRLAYAWSRDWHRAEDLVQTTLERVYRRWHGHGGTGLLALAAGWAAVAAPGPAGHPTPVPISLPAAGGVTSTPHGTPSTTDTAQRLTRGLGELLRREGISPLPASDDGGRVGVFAAGLYNNPSTVFQTDLTIERASAAGVQGGIGLFVTVDRAPVNPPADRLGGPRCLASDRTLPSTTCTDGALPDGTTLAVRINLYRDQPVGGSVTALRPNGTQVSVGTEGDYFHRWPTGVDAEVLQRMAVSDLLAP